MYTLSYNYTVEKTGMLKCFCNSSGTDIGADNSSQIIPVKIMVDKVGIGFGYHDFLLLIFDCYYPHLYYY